MSTEAYQTVLDVVIEEGGFGDYHTLRSLSPEKQILQIEAIFLHAVEAHADEFALRYLDWLRHAFEDKECISLTEEGKNGGMVIESYSKEVIEAKKRAQKACSHHFMPLYERLPQFRVGGHREPIEFPTLLETRKAMLTAIADWWRETDDAEETLTFFEFLFSIETRFKEEVSIILDVIRAATNEKFSPHRLELCLLRLQSEECRSNRDPRTSRKFEVGKILAIARARNSNMQFWIRDARISHSLGDLLDESAIEVLEVEAISRLKALEDASQKLIQKMQPRDRDGFSSGPGIRGDLDLRYLSLKAIQVTISMRLNFRESKEVLEDEYSKACQLVREWKKAEGRGISISLRVYKEKEFSSEQEVAFEREFK